MGCQADGVIMLRGAEPERPRSDFLQNFHKRGNTWIVSSFWFFHRGCTRLKARDHGFGRFGDQGGSVCAEQVSVRMRNPRQLPPSHSLAAKEARAVFTGV